MDDGTEHPDTLSDLYEVERVLEAHRAIHDLTEVTSQRLDCIAQRMRRRLPRPLRLLGPED